VLEAAVHLNELWNDVSVQLMPGVCNLISELRPQVTNGGLWLAVDVGASLDEDQREDVISAAEAILYQVLATDAQKYNPTRKAPKRRNFAVVAYGSTACVWPESPPMIPCEPATIKQAGFGS